MADSRGGEKPLTGFVLDKVKDALPQAPSSKEHDSSPADIIFKEGVLKDWRKLRPADEPVITRFPPEPNGFLHIGHAKAITVNFGFARFHGGKCILRYDDTNPEKEEEIYFTSILEIVRWLGFEPYRITYSSDNFQKLYDLAEELIKKDGAYICHCSPKELKEQRGGDDDKNKKPRFACKHRDRPTEDSLAEFRSMGDGKYKPGEAFLRFKTDDYVNGNPQMWDVAAYRIIEEPHYRTGDKWRIYPTYDFAHCLCDSIENISHSLCTTEFQLSRTSYEWLNNKLDVPHKPMQREYGRLNIEGTIMSKRKLKRLVDEKIVRGWDDPRLFTLVALRRRGVPPGAIISFIGELGVTVNRTFMQPVRFAQAVRKYLETTVPRLMMVLDPIPLILDNLPEDFVEEIDNPFGPKEVDMGSHTMPFTKTVYIERTDFREVDSKDYKGLAPGKSVGLMKVTYPVTATSFDKDESAGAITRIHATYDKPADGGEFKKPKGYIHWVADSPSHGSPIRVEAREFNALFKSDNPDDVKPDFTADLAENSEKIYHHAMIEVGFNEISRRRPWPQEAGESKKENCGPESVRFQAVRNAYFCMDKDSADDKVVLNRIVTMKEDTSKNDEIKKAELAKREAAAKAKKANKEKKGEKSKGVSKAKGDDAVAENAGAVANTTTGEAKAA